MHNSNRHFMFLVVVIFFVPSIVENSSHADVRNPFLSHHLVAFKHPSHLISRDRNPNFPQNNIKNKTSIFKLRILFPNGKTGIQKNTPKVDNFFLNIIGFFYFFSSGIISPGHNDWPETCTHLLCIIDSSKQQPQLPSPSLFWHLNHLNHSACKHPPPLTPHK